MKTSAVEQPASVGVDPVLAAEERARQVRRAEELLFSGPSREGFVKALFRGELLSEGIFPYPELSPERRAEADAAEEEVRNFCESEIDPAKIDRTAEIAGDVIDGLGRVGVLGMTAPVEYGGRGFTQSQYCRVMEIIGGHCASTGVFVNAHHSIGIRALLLFGTEEQKSRWLPDLTRGSKLAAFALTEPEAGSDAANVRTIATPSADGKSFRLNGTKRWITNGGIADVLTVMARTPDPKGGESKVSAFLVTPDLPGFNVLEARMPKCGIRGTATARLAFEDMDVPAENLLGPLGKGLRVALTVLDFGRTTFGACCAGVAKRCLADSVRHANRRRQFGRSIGDFELIRKKIGFLAASAYAIESTVYEVAALIDRGADDYMLETAILKVFATEQVWQGVYDTLQIHGGLGYFNDQPYERMMRDARINTIGEGANEVLKSFIALVGMRDVGEGFRAALPGLKSPKTFFSTLGGLAKPRLARTFRPGKLHVVSRSLKGRASRLSSDVRRFGWTIDKLLVRHRENLLEMQYHQERIADAVIALFTSACVLARLDREISTGSGDDLGRAAAELYLRTASRTFNASLRALGRNDDAATSRAAMLALRSFS